MHCSPQAPPMRGSFNAKAVSAAENRFRFTASSLLGVQNAGKNALNMDQFAASGSESAIDCAGGMNIECVANVVPEIRLG